MMQDIPYRGICPVCGADSPGSEPIVEEGRLCGTRWLCRECGATLGGTGETVPEEEHVPPTAQSVEFFKVLTRSAPWRDRGRFDSEDAARQFISGNCLAGIEVRVVRVRQDTATGSTRESIVSEEVLP